MKKVIALSVILVISLIFSIGAEAASTAENIMTLEEAVAVARENSRQAVIDNLDIKMKNILLKKAREAAENLGTAYGYENLLNNDITREVNVMEAEYNITIAEMTAEENLKKLEQDVYRTYMNILLAKKDLELSQEKQKIAEEKCKITRARKSAGTVTEDQISSAEFDLYSKKADVEAKKEKLGLLDMELKSLLNLPYDSKTIEVEGSIEMVPFNEIDIDELVNKQKDVGLEVFTEECSVKLAEKTLELTKKYFLPGSDIYDQNEMKLNAAYRNLNNAKRNREARIRNTYNELLNIIDSFKLAEEYEKLQQKKLSNIQIRYNKGQINREQLLAAKENYLDAVYNKIKSIYDVNIKRYEFETLIVKEKNSQNDET